MKPDRPLFRLLYRPIIALSTLVGLFLLTELFALGGLTWRNLQRIDTIRQDIKQSHELQQLMFELLEQRFSETPHPALREKITTFFTAQRQHAAPQTPDLLMYVESLMMHLEQGDKTPTDLIDTLRLVERVLQHDRNEEENLLRQLYRDSQLEFELALLLPFGLLLGAYVTGLHFLRKRVIKPLQRLQTLLLRLIDGEMQPLDEPPDEPLMRPLFSNYNQLIIRLRQLERQHQMHAQSLEHEIRKATHTLLEQSQSLARAERLAAVGELAASAAHELRNPLAGILAALQNIRRDCQDAQLVERLDRVQAEIKRLTLRLNDLLAYAQHTPEPAKPVDLAVLLDDLVTLLHYQTPEHIQFHTALAPPLYPVVPETELRQALLNLLLNAVQVMPPQGGTITIRAQLDTPEQLTIRIEDQGPGFPDALLQHGIRPFVSYREHGTGLGLPMVQRFARAVGGQLVLGNTPQGHAQVTLILPYSPEATRTKGRAASDYREF